jgi:16S rRNA (adenine1518-N6/adenine1519-N6)-dimethyltransferase
VLEVGPGPGGLTRALLEAAAERVVAIEMNPRFLPLLAELADAAEGRLVVSRRRSYRRSRRPARRARARLAARVVANLPYNVARCSCVGWLMRIAAYEKLHLISSGRSPTASSPRPGDDAYGPRRPRPGGASVELVMDLPARAFPPAAEGRQPPSSA